MATPRKGSTTPKDLKDDAGGLVAGGGPDLSGTAMPPSKPASSRTRSKPAEGVDTAGGRKGTGSEKTAAKPRSKAAGSTAKGTAPGKAAGSSTVDGGVGKSSAPPGTGGAAQAAAGATAETGTGAAGNAGMSDEERQRRIAEAAYRKAQERGFAGDRQLDDWLEAEREHNEAQGRTG